jgi:NHS family xanthosine MFS transporter
MSLKFRLIVMNFLEYFVWGTWLISFGGYLIVTLGFSGSQVGKIYATMGVASLIMPALLGIVADRWINAEKLLGLCHIFGGILLWYAATITNYDTMYFVILAYSMVYMPTIALSNVVSFATLKKEGIDIIKVFPPIRVWGTVGFIFGMWLTDLLGFTTSPFQLVVSALASIALGLYSFTLPSCPPAKTTQDGSLLSALGLNAFVLFKEKRMLIFFVFAMLLGAALQITNTFGEPFLHDFKDLYPDSFAVNHPSLLISISQVSETLFILTIPFFLHRFGIKRVMVISVFAWVFRFAFFGLGDPGSGLILLVLSMIIYGMAFDFFLISGSLFIEREANANIRASAQGLFMLMTNGIGAYIGATISGWVVDYFTVDGIRHWPYIWFAFAGYALFLGLIFPFAFKYDSKKDVKVVH